MHENHVYNLMQQLTQEHKALWRMKNNYITDAEDCDECVEMWKRLEKDKEEHIEELTKMLKNHIS